jgi:hypothetical protein
MTVDDFRRIALSLESAKDGSHMDQAIFGSEAESLQPSPRRARETNVKLTPEQQAAPGVFVPIPGG